MAPLLAYAIAIAIVPNTKIYSIFKPKIARGILNGAPCMKNIFA
jgi:hypothetical protein